MTLEIRREGGVLQLTTLEFDSDLFGARVGRIEAATAPSEDVFKALYAESVERAKAEGYRQLVRRIAAQDLFEFWALLAVGFRPVDIGTTLRHSLEEAHLPIANGADEMEVVAASAADIVDLSERLKGVFTTSYFYADPFYGHARADELHRRWLRNCHEGGLADVIFVARDKGMPIGYCACRVDPASRVGSIPLVAVDPQQRGRGVGRAVVTCALRWFAANASKALVRTQVYNHAAVALYESLGFRSFASDVTLTRQI